MANPSPSATEAARLERRTAARDDAPRCRPPGRPRAPATGDLEPEFARSAADL